MLDISHWYTSNVFQSHLCHYHHHLASITAGHRSTSFCDEPISWSNITGIPSVTRFIASLYFRSQTAHGLLPAWLPDSVYIDRIDKYSAEPRDMWATARKLYGWTLCSYDLVDSEATCDEWHMCHGWGRACDTVYGGAFLDHTWMGMLSSLLVDHCGIVIRPLLDTHTSDAVLWVFH